MTVTATINWEIASIDNIVNFTIYRSLFYDFTPDTTNIIATVASDVRIYEDELTRPEDEDVLYWYIVRANVSGGQTIATKPISYLALATTTITEPPLPKSEGHIYSVYDIDFADDYIASVSSSSSDTRVIEHKASTGEQQYTFDTSINTDTAMPIGRIFYDNMRNAYTYVSNTRRLNQTKTEGFVNNTQGLLARGQRTSGSGLHGVVGTPCIMPNGDSYEVTGNRTIQFDPVFLRVAKRDVNGEPYYLYSASGAGSGRGWQINDSLDDARIPHSIYARDNIITVFCSGATNSPTPGSTQFQPNTAFFRRFTDDTFLDLIDEIRIADIYPANFPTNNIFFNDAFFINDSIFIIYRNTTSTERNIYISKYDYLTLNVVDTWHINESRDDITDLNITIYDISPDENRLYYNDSIYDFNTGELSTGIRAGFNENITCIREHNNAIYVGYSSGAIKKYSLDKELIYMIKSGNS